MLASEFSESSSRSDQISVRMGPRVFDPDIWSENVDEAVRCLSVASSGPRDVFASNLESRRLSGSPSFGYFSWRSKKNDCPAA
jgi:hypothetical protein